MYQPVCPQLLPYMSENTCLQYHRSARSGQPRAKYAGYYFRHRHTAHVHHISRRRQGKHRVRRTAKQSRAIFHACSAESSRGRPREDEKSREHPRGCTDMTPCSWKHRRVRDRTASVTLEGRPQEIAAET
ncbi:hypothetical protein BD309DRAFT_434125 [Dichomitus squalens]|nr:hypothetical protein BD309DRAFT_434125 [Dichomitus squalens]